MQGGDWEKVVRKGRMGAARTTKWDMHSVSKNQKEVKKVTYFYFSEFPYDCVARDIFDIFIEFGDLEEIIIPPRRNKIM